MAELARGSDAPVEAATSDVVADYRPGPISRLLAWLDASTPRLWLFTIGISVALVAWAHAVLWATGRLVAWTVDANVFLLVVYVSYFFPGAVLGLRIARRATKAFWPATGWPETAQRAWIYRFSAIPMRYELAAIAVGVVVGIGGLLGAPDAVVGPQEGRIGSFIALLPNFLGGYVLNTIGIVLSVRWLSLVAEIHRDARAINPFDRIPIYAFSRLTVYVGLVILVMTYFTFAFNAPFISGNVPALLELPVTTGLSIGAFIVPLWGIHQRLVRIKAALFEDVERRTTLVSTELYDRLDARAFDGAKVVSDSLSALTTLRERIRRVPTWPWPPQLLRGFVSALLLPIVIYLITRTIGGVLPF
jgi:hypothetical protein